MNQDKVIWRHKHFYYDQDSGELINKNDLHNYQIKKKTKHASVQNGYGTIEHTIQCERIYRSDLFENT